MRAIKVLTRLGCIAALFASPLAVQAADLDLTTDGATGVINGATYTQVPPQSTGTGVIDPFVRVQTNNTVVQGYNTTVNNTFDNTSENNYNHQVTVGEIGFIDLGGGNVVMRFLLDINQTGADPTLFLNDVQIFLSDTPNTDVESFTGGLLDIPNSTLVYHMDAGADSSVLLDFSLNHGSGSGDMTLDIPLATFQLLGLSADALNDSFLYLYSNFGLPDNTEPGYNNDGFEEWAFFQGNPAGEPPCIPTPENNFCGPQEIPEPGVLALAALGLFSGALASRRRRK